MLSVVFCLTFSKKRRVSLVLFQFSSRTHSNFGKMLSRNCVVGRKRESKPVSLTKQNDSKRNYSSPANPKYKPRALIAANNNVYRTIRKKIFAVF